MTLSIAELKESSLKNLLRREDLSPSQVSSFFNYLIAGQLDDPYIAGVLALQAAKGISESEFIAAINSAYHNALEIPATADLRNSCLDIVGTGGDHQNLINISTSAGLVAGAMGYKVAKHGNRGVSSLTGASDLLSQLGFDFNLTPQQVIKLIEQQNFCFLFAPLYHGGFRFAAPARASLGIATIFNYLGPLVNPLQPGQTLLGCCSPEIFELYKGVTTRIHQAQPQRKYCVVLGEVDHTNAIDEVSLSGVTHVCLNTKGHQDNFNLTAADFGLKPFPIAHLRGKDPATNARIIKQIFTGQALIDNPQQAYYEQAIAANLALALQLYQASDLKQTTQQILEFIASGKVASYLEQLIIKTSEIKHK